jgi:NitT/TauT family transport system ATP-binding protein
MQVRANVAFPMIASKKYGRKEAFERAEHFIGLVNIGKFAETYPHQLSGGMKQRVAIARAIAMEPDILLMDEPFASLDALTWRKMQDELLSLWHRVRCTIVFVTHSIEEAILLGTRILVLSPHPGRVQALRETKRGADGQLLPDEFRILRTQIHQMLFGEELVFGVSSRSGGLGWYIFENKNRLETANVFAGLGTVIIIVLLVETLVFRTIERHTIRKWGMQR